MCHGNFNTVLPNQPLFQHLKCLILSVKVKDILTTQFKKTRNTTPSIYVRWN